MSCSGHQVVPRKYCEFQEPSARTSYYPVEIVNPRGAAWRGAVGLTNTPFCGQTKGPGQQQQPSALRPAFNLPQHTNGSLEMRVWLSGLEKWRLIGSRVYLGNVNGFVTTTWSPTKKNTILSKSEFWVFFIQVITVYFEIWLFSIKFGFDVSLIKSNRPTKLFYLGKKWLINS